MNKTKIILALTLTLGLLTPLANAAPLPDDTWVIQNAITNLNLEHPETTKLSLNAVIVSGWETHGTPTHKHVEITATWGYHNTGTLYVYLRSYAEGGILIQEYSYTEAEISPQAKWDSLYICKTSTDLYYDGSGYQFQPRFFWFLDKQTDATITVTVTNGANTVYKQTYTLEYFTGLITFQAPYQWTGYQFTAKIDGVTYPAQLP